MIDGKIVLTLGTKQLLFENGGTYSREDCSTLESVISCNVFKFAQVGMGVTISFFDKNGLKETMRIIEGNSSLDDETNNIVLTSLLGESISSVCYFGNISSAGFHFVGEKLDLSNEDSTIQAIKDMEDSWVVEDGKVLKVAKDKVLKVLIVNDRNIMKRVLDEGFDSYYVFLAV